MNKAKFYTPPFEPEDPFHSINPYVQVYNKVVKSLRNQRFKKYEFKRMQISNPNFIHYTDDLTFDSINYKMKTKLQEGRGIGFCYEHPYVSYTHYL